jgi:hypothetical protein
MSIVFNLPDKPCGAAGWVCHEPVKVVGKTFEPFFKEVVLIRVKGDLIIGREMVKLVQEQGSSTGFCHAEAMFLEQQKIPAELRENHLVFPEIWQHVATGDRVFYYLGYANFGKWYLNFGSLDGGRFSVEKPLIVECHN